MREKTLWNFVYFCTFIVLITEILSSINSLNRVTVTVSWILIICYFLINNIKFFNIITIRNLFNNSFYLKNKFIIFFLISIILLTFFTSIIYPPTTPDSLAYHLPRVMQWIQNENVNFFTTPDHRQLMMPPFSEYFILHLQLITNSDYLANVPQWLAMLFSLITASLITKELGGNKRFQLISAFIVATIPMGILQSSSTQTDYILSFWLITLIYFLTLYLKTNHLKYLFGFSLSLGLGILTKQNMYLFALPFCFWLLFYFIKYNLSKIYYLFLVFIIILTINFGHYYRNINMYGNPIGFHSQNIKAVNENFSKNYIVSNIIRNLSLNFTFPSQKINHEIRSAVKSIHKIINVPILNEENTFDKSYFLYFSTYESHAGNTLHFILVWLLIIYILYKKKFNTHLVKYLICIISSFLLFSIFLKVQTTNSRFLLALFIGITPLLSITLEKINNKNLTNFILLSLYLWAMPYLFMNSTRPLIGNIEKKGKSIIFKKNDLLLNYNRNKLYFVQTPYLYHQINEITDKIVKNRCTNIGITNGMPSTYEYSFWVMLKQKFGENNFKISHTNVKNVTKKKNNFSERINFCSIIQLKCNTKNINCNNINEKTIKKFYNNRIIKNDFSLFY
jgi:4-amino-4-deoxy-L-arabinose transferase-like glycosyltransferase